jgi:RNA polymerase sigma-70 factor (ECF subfamily)
MLLGPPGSKGPDPKTPLADDKSIEESLVAAARAGDTAAFNRLVLRHQDAVYTLCYRLTGNAEDAADAAQEAFLSAFRHLADFRGGAFRSWLLRIAANASYDLHRQRRRRPSDSLDRQVEGETHTVEVVDSAPGPEAVTLTHELEHLLQAGLLELPEDQRLAVVLCDLYEFDYQAIAQATGAELGTVKSRINRGRRRLRDYLLRHRELLPKTYRPSEERSAR